MSERPGRPARVVAAVAAAIVVLDVIALNVVGDLPNEGWWFLAVPIGLVVVPIVGVVALVAAVSAR